MSTWQDLKNNPRLMQVYQARLEITRLIREFFWSREFKEVETPIAVRYPSQEPYLNPIPVVFHDPYSKPEKFYLHTSPELSLKKILAAGFDKIFQICKCFRDYEQFGGLHNTEFTMIEWYRSPGELEEIMDDTEKLFKFVAEKLKIKNIKYKDRTINIVSNWERKSMRELWQEYVEVELNDYVVLRSIHNLRKLCIKLGIQINESDEYEDLFFKIFLNEIEPKLGLERPIFIYDYPACMCSLSKLCEYDKRYAQRFELYIGGLELANAFGELTDADEQKKRLEKDKELRIKLGKPTWDVDPDFIESLRSKTENQAGLPAVAPRSGAEAGVALGIDRMVLLFTGANDINEVIFQSVSDQLQI